MKQQIFCRYYIGNSWFSSQKLTILNNAFVDVTGELIKWQMKLKNKKLSGLITFPPLYEKNELCLISHRNVPF